jgi:hypothetical protein
VLDWLFYCGDRPVKSMPAYAGGLGILASVTVRAVADYFPEAFFDCTTQTGDRSRLFDLLHF